MRPNLTIWMVNLDRAPGDLGLLSAEEQQRADSLKWSHDRIRYLNAHCALRRILAEELRVIPRFIEFATTALGKPYLIASATNLEFSLSHSGGYGLIAVARGHLVGADIEVQRPMLDLLPVVFQFATTQEAKAFQLLSTSQTRSAFFDLWTRKEALLKALGGGFLIDPREVEVEIGPDRSYVNFAERSWTIESLAIRSGVRAAVAIEGVFETPLVWEQFEWV